MFHVFRYDDEGHPILLSIVYDIDDVDDAVERYSNKYPHAFVDYVYKDV